MSRHCVEAWAQHPGILGNAFPDTAEVLARQPNGLGLAESPPVPPARRPPFVPAGVHHDGDPTCIRVGPIPQRGDGIVPLEWWYLTRLRRIGGKHRKLETGLRRFNRLAAAAEPAGRPGRAKARVKARRMGRRADATSAGRGCQEQSWGILGTPGDRGGQTGHGPIRDHLEGSPAGRSSNSGSSVHSWRQASQTPRIWYPPGSDPAPLTRRASGATPGGRPLRRPRLSGTGRGICSPRAAVDARSADLCQNDNMGYHAFGWLEGLSSKAGKVHAQGCRAAHPSGPAGSGECA